MALLSQAEINDLPDSAFAYIEPGGKKDASGKTVPRSLRHYPVHDQPHAANALARATAQIASGDSDAKRIAKLALPAIKKAVAKFKPAANRSRARKGERQRAVPLSPEVRFFSPEGLEVRSSRDSDEIIITGSPIMYGAGYKVVDHFGEFRETIHPGAVASILPRVDCRFLLNHEGLAMARTASGTLTLRDTPKALTFEARLDARQQIANDLAIAVERGDVNQMSIGMIVGDDEWAMDGQMETRDIYKLRDLLDVSAVTYACSPTTHMAVAQRMALAVPVESRARLRRLYTNLRAGRALSKDELNALGVILGEGPIGKRRKPDDAQRSKARRAELEATRERLERSAAERAQTDLARRKRVRSERAARQASIFERARRSR